MRRSPQNVSKHCWYYEEPKGICVVIHAGDLGGLPGRTLMATIPWKMIRGSLKRKDRKRTTRRKPVSKVVPCNILDGRPIVLPYLGGFNFNGEECRT